MNFFDFYTGQVFNAYEFLGAHQSKQGVVFRVYAPSAKKICLIGEFNEWQEHEMTKVCDGNFYECCVDNARAGMMYKYRVYGQDDSCVDHCDPFGFSMELRPRNASIITCMNDYIFHDDHWINQKHCMKNQPLNIYEIHFGSFKKPSQSYDDWYSYEDMIDILIPYLKEMGYNYLEIMPLNEYPCDESWGYQSTGFYAPTSRYGTPLQLKKFIDICHQNDIGVIMDFIPVHFAIDSYALARFDGTPLYEYPHQAVGMSEWGSCNFMHSRGEVRSFLQSAANYWLKEFHFDGLRMDAISRAIYWQGNPERGVNLNAIEFLKTMNQGLKERFPHCLLIAEDSTSYPGVTKPVCQGGLGFDYKWDMGWMNDTLDYFHLEFNQRHQHYHKLTFSMMYYYQEYYLLPLSHDEVVHGKGTIIQKMNGSYEEKFAQARAFYMYMYGHPGKKLNFMGNEIAQFREWDEKRQQDWQLLSYPLHDSFARFMRDLNRFYLYHPALFELDECQEGFQWIDCHQEDKCIYIFERFSSCERIVAVFHFSNKKYENFVLKVDHASYLQEIFSSQRDIYGGNEKDFGTVIEKKDEHFTIAIQPFSATYYFVK